MKKLIIYSLALIILASCNNSETNCTELQTENKVLREKLASAEQKNNELAELIVSLQGQKGKKKQKSNTSGQEFSTSTPNVYTATPKKDIQDDTYSGQCAAITKKGTRCSRSAKYGSYCWQHNR